MRSLNLCGAGIHPRHKQFAFASCATCAGLPAQASRHFFLESWAKDRASLAARRLAANRKWCRIEIAVTYSKQTPATLSNRNSPRGVPRPNQGCQTKTGETVQLALNGSLATRHSPLATDFLIATLAISEFESNRSKQRRSHFSNRNKNSVLFLRVSVPPWQSLAVDSSTQNPQITCRTPPDPLRYVIHKTARTAQ